jgi:hypothetical protein
MFQSGLRDASARNTKETAVRSGNFKTLVILARKR